MSNAALAANLVSRVLFAVLGSALCWVPLRQLVRNGEFAAPVLISTVVLLNAFTVVNALLWRSDDWARWPTGAGLCDVEIYLTGPLLTVYAAAMFEIMRHLAAAVRNVAAPPPRDARARRRRNALSLLVIFPVPLAQLAFTWFDLGQRYMIGTLVGCAAVYDDSWPRIVFFTLPPALFALGTAPYAFLTWQRFRHLTRFTKSAVCSNSVAAARAQRTRRRLYQMSMSILLPYLPLQLAFLAWDVCDGAALLPYDYRRIHYPDYAHDARLYPWNSVLFVPSAAVPFVVMNQPWIPILTTLPIFLFFGLTHEAVETYRRYARALGLGGLLRRGRRGGGEAGASHARTGSGSSSRPMVSLELDEHTAT